MDDEIWQITDHEYLPYGLRGIVCGARVDATGLNTNDRPRGVCWEPRERHAAEEEAPGAVDGGS